MRRSMQLLLLSPLAALLALPVSAVAQPTLQLVSPGKHAEDSLRIPEISTFDYTQNMHPMGYSPRVVPLDNAEPGSGVFNTDLAFWGKLAYQGSYEGFRIIDITEPDNPVELNNFTDCPGNQGDVIVWEDLLIRSWNSPAPSGGVFCGNLFTPAGEEGVHVFDVSDPLNPVGLAFVATPCGSHTATGVPDLDNGRLLVYNSSSSGSVGCRGLDIIEVPLDDPASASYLRFEPSGDPSPLPFEVVVDEPSSAAGSYQATGAEFGPAADEIGVGAGIVLAEDGSGTNEGCDPFVGFTAGSIALVDRGTCGFVQKASNAQAAGAVALIVANNSPGNPITMGGTDPTITIPSVMVFQADGSAIKAGLPASGTVRLAEQPETPDRSCHDTGVILGDAGLVACAGGNGFTVWSLNSADGGSLADPAILYSRSVDGVGIGHSAGFTWDGEVLVFDHEPGGGGQAQCQETSLTVNKSLFFFDSRSGDELGTFVLPRAQTSTENCTWHNYTAVPTGKGYVLVSGNYQSGISVVDFSDPANAFEIAYADPAPLVNPANPNAIELGGDWSTYWYDGRIYESDITRGLFIWDLHDSAVAGATKLGHLNPQTQEMTID